MNNKKLVHVISVAMAVFIVLAGLVYLVFHETSQRFQSQRLIFEMGDPSGDDYGPGTYKYPTDSIFDPKAGHFDLVNFKVLAERDHYLFELEMGRITNPWGAAEGFSHQIMQIYIANGSENGQIETFKEGANVQFSPKYPWTSLVKVVSFGKTAVYQATDYETSEGKSKGVEAQLAEDNKTVRVQVPKHYLSGDPELWSYYVLVGSQDGSGPDNYRPVLVNVTRWNFGGGTATRYHPNVIDILALPDGGQERMLQSYDPAKGRLALLEPVSPQVVEMSLLDYCVDSWDGFLEYMEGIFKGLGITL